MKPPPPPPSAGLAVAPLADAALVAQPRVNCTNPQAHAVGVRRDAFISADVRMPHGGIRLDTCVAANVHLPRAADGTRVPAVLNTSGGGDVIVLRPEETLDADTQYTFHVTAGLKDVAGTAFLPFELSFTTGAEAGGPNSSVKFTKSQEADGDAYTSLAVGPDRRLYAATFDGHIIRWRIKDDGSLGSEERFDIVRDRNGGARTISGILFDPESTPSNPVLWISHSAYGLTGAADWTGKISHLQDSRDGDDLSDLDDKVVGLPRASRDHMTNQMVWGPDGAIYFNQGSSSAMGAPDVGWGNRPEHLLTGAILRVDVDELPDDGDDPLDVKTHDGRDGGYDPSDDDAPLTIYATGVRNAYNILWHSNGQLYAPANGSASGGNTPAGDDAPALTGVTRSQHDFLFRIEEGGYYGHPNPVRDQFVMNGGNPTAGRDAAEVDDYPIGTRPDDDYRGFAYDFGDHISPNGTIEYTNGQAFGGALLGKILVCRYSGPDDIMVLGAAADGSVTADEAEIEGFGGFNNPVDLVEDPVTGNIYVAEFGPEDSSDEPGGRKITLLRPAVPGTAAPFSSDDVGETPRGSTDTVLAGRSYDITAGGYNVGGAADAFRFLHAERSGDFDVLVQLQSLEGEGDGDDDLSPIAKAGLMVREAMSAGARNVFAGATAADGFRFSTRATQGGITQLSKDASGTPAAQGWVRLRRAGNVFTGFHSADGVTWTQTGRATVALPAAVQFGLIVTSGSPDPDDTVTAEFRNLADYAPPAAAAAPDAPAAPAPAAPAPAAEAPAETGAAVATDSVATDPAAGSTPRALLLDAPASAALPADGTGLVAAAPPRDGRLMITGGKRGRRRRPRATCSRSTRRQTIGTPRRRCRWAATPARCRSSPSPTSPPSRPAATCSSCRPTAA